VPMSHSASISHEMQLIRHVQWLRVWPRVWPLDVHAPKPGAHQFAQYVTNRMATMWGVFWSRAVNQGFSVSASRGQQARRYLTYMNYAEWHIGNNIRGAEELHGCLAIYRSGLLPHPRPRILHAGLKPCQCLACERGLTNHELGARWCWEPTCGRHGSRIGLV
jgi:hypothetical protein